MPKVDVFIQARMSSKRLPGKVLRRILNKPMLKYLLEQTSALKEIGRVIVLTSTDSSDDVIAEFAKASGYACFRGSLSNVASRFFDALQHYQPDYFIRLTADSPLHHRDIIAQGVQLGLSGKYDVVTNVLPRSFPAGCSFELMESSVFLDAYSDINEQSDLEHIFPYFYRNRDKYTISNFTNEIDLSHIHLAVDTVDDFNRVEKILDKMGKDYFSYSWTKYCQYF